MHDRVVEPVPVAQNPWHFVPLRTIETLNVQPLIH